MSEELTGTRPLDAGQARAKIAVPFILCTLIWSSTWLVIRHAARRRAAGLVDRLPLHRSLAPAMAGLCDRLTKRPAAASAPRQHGFAAVYGVAQYALQLRGRLRRRADGDVGAGRGGVRAAGGAQRTARLGLPETRRVPCLPARFGGRGGGAGAVVLARVPRRRRRGGRDGSSPASAGRSSPCSPHPMANVMQAAKHRQGDPGRQPDRCGA